APVYNNSGWDLVDAAKGNPSAVATLKDDDLPAEMKKMDEKERIAYVDKKSKERSAIQSKISKLSTERAKYVDKEIKKQSGANTLDAAIITSIRKQAVKKGYSFE
ncbi:MAG TPA: VWA domain-containing protein, partial [Spirochaetota bacterium]